MCSNFNYKPQTESHQQHLALHMDRHLHSVAIMIVTSRHMECTHFNLNNSQMLRYNYIGEDVAFLSQSPLLRNTRHLTVVQEK